MMRRPFAVFLAIFAATALYTFTRPKLYEATAKLQLPARIHQSEPVVHTETIQSSEESSATYIKIAESNVIIQRVAARLPAADLEHLRAHRRAGFDLTTRSLTIAYRAHDPTSAAQVANLLAEEVNAFFVRTHEDENRFAIDYLQARTDTQARVVASSTAALAAHLAPSDPQTPDPAFQTLERELAANQNILTQLQSRLAEARTYKTPFRITPATPPAPGDYVSPPILLHLTLGALAGILAAVLAARRLRPHPASAQSSIGQK